MIKRLSALSFSCFVTVCIPTWANDDIAWYREGKKAIEKNDVTLYKTADRHLNQSLLQPYLRYHYFQKNLQTLSPDEVIKFANQYNDRAFTANLKQNVYNAQRAQNNLSFILKHGANESSLPLKCYFYEAQIKSDAKQFNAEAFKSIWLSQNMLPAACNQVEVYWLNQFASESLIKGKVEKLIHDLYLKKASSLLERLPINKRQYYRDIIQIIGNPQALLNQKTYYKDSSKFYTLSILQWGKKDSTAALQGLEFVRKNNLVTTQDYQKLRNQLAVYQAGRKDAHDPLARIRAIPLHEQNDEVKEWGFRLSALKKDCTAALDFLSRLSPEKSAEPTWAYWTGRMYQCLGNTTKANESYEKIASHTSFYGFLAADQLKHPYRVLNAMVNDKNNKAEPLNNTDFKTALRLFQVNEISFARSEWMRGIREASQNQKHSASIQGIKNNLYDLSLRAAIHARMQGGLYLRYPMAYSKEIQHYAKKNHLPAALIWGLSRQESLFQADIKSHADAYGLMQLLMPTAKKMAERLGEKPSSILIPDANIRYGTAYLQYVSELVGKQWPYILASYNAGPHKVKDWTQAPSQDIVLWIETIPYKETRNYVKTVIENAIIYHALQNETVKVSQYLTPF